MEFLIIFLVFVLFTILFPYYGLVIKFIYNQYYVLKYRSMLKIILMTTSKTY